MKPRAAMGRIYEQKDKGFDDRAGQGGSRRNFGACEFLL